MLKEFLKEQHISIYKLAKLSNVPYSTVNDLVNYKLSVENIRAGQLKSMADVLCVDLGTLYDMCVFRKSIYSKKYKISAKIEINQKKYCLSYIRNGKEYYCEILPVKNDVTTYIEVLAEWKLDEEIEKLQLEDAYETIHSKAQG